MAGKAESCLIGGIGCLVVVVGGGLAVALVGGHFHIDLGGAVILLVMGGAAGLVVNAAYEKGKQDGATAEGVAEGGSVPSGRAGSGSGGTRRRSPVFVPPWGSEVPATVSDALSKLSEKFWMRDDPATQFSEDGISISFRSRSVADDRVLELVASDASDSVTIGLRDALGDIFAPTGPWRSPSGPNADLSEVFHFVESVFMETSVHVLSSSGEHRLAQRTEIEALIAADPGLRVASWNGNFDRNCA